MKIMMIVCLLFSSFFLSCNSLGSRRITFKQRYSQNGSCFERQYKISKKFVGPLGDFKKVQDQFCDKLLGTDLDDYDRLVRFYKKLK